MLNKAKLILAGVWLSLASFFSAGWLGFTYVFISGHSKGYGYDLGPEKRMIILIGIVLLAIWIAAVVPAAVWLCKKCCRYKKTYILVPLAVFTALFVLGMFSMGIDNFIGCFGAGPTPS